MRKLSTPEKTANTGNINSMDRFKAIETKKWDEIEQPATLGELMSGLPAAQ
jgi:hypothetical protein